MSEPDYCALIEVDGEAIRVRLAKPADQLSDVERGYLVDIVRAAKRKAVQGGV